MASHRTSDEVHEEYVAKMGAELGGQFSRFFNECALLHLKWREYNELFGTNRQRIELLNESARGLFGLIQSLLWEDILLHICRLTDDSAVGGRRRQTLSLRRLPDLVEPSIRREVRTLVADAVRKSAKGAIAPISRRSDARRAAHRRSARAPLATVRGELLRAQEGADVAQKSARDAWAFAKLMFEKRVLRDIERL
jgi:hypothetical protein